MSESLTDSELKIIHEVVRSALDEGPYRFMVERLVDAVRLARAERDAVRGRHLISLRYREVVEGLDPGTLTRPEKESWK